MARRAEMAHIGVKRFAARHRQHHRAQRDKGGPGFVRRTARRHSGDWRRTGSAATCRIAARAQHGHDDEPHHHHRPEHLADLLGAAALQQEQADQDDQGERHDQGVKALAADAQAFHRRQHRNRRRQHAVAIEQRQAQQGGDADGGLGARG